MVLILEMEMKVGVIQRDKIRELGRIQYVQSERGSMGVINLLGKASKPQTESMIVQRTPVSKRYS